MESNLFSGSSIHRKFKGLSQANPYQLTKIARKGVSVKVFFDLAESIKMSTSSLASIINLATRALTQIHTLQKTLKPAQSEHLLKLIRLFEKGERLFGSVDEFKYWLNKSFWMGKERPIEWLATPGGVNLLRMKMEKMAHCYPF